MNLKEAFRYQNFLDGLLSSCMSSLSSRSNVLTVTKVHKCSAANPDAKDVTEDQDRTGTCMPNDVISVMDKILDARKALSEAITKAKAGMGFDLDAELAYVKAIRSAASGLDAMLMHKASTKTDRGMGYKFNAEGNQVTYSYDMEITYAENFDRKAIKARYKDMLKRADDASSAIEKALVETDVAFDPPFDVNDSFEDIVPVA